MVHSLAHVLAGIAFFITVWWPCPAQSTESTGNRFFVSAHALGAVGSDMETMSNSAVGVGWSVRGGLRQDWLGLFAECQRDFWLATDKDVEMTKGVINLGVGAEIMLFDERLKMSLAMGTSTLLFDAIFDEAGTTGMYVDFQPTVFRWRLTRRLVFELSPFGATLMIPAVAAPMLKRLEYRTTLGLEWQF
ncbi:MAG: hypothetical protein JXX14_00105 [Deltaproteobacteria bacterium]|nr:hypothetical protein [Deltaproteobacteria bacterium]